MTYNNLSEYFRGANTGRALARRFDAFTWWVHSVQNTFPN